MKINLPIFKDEGMKDAITYQSLRWDLTVYGHARCQDCTLLPYAIQSLYWYPGELVRSLGMDITLDHVLTILDEHYNNVKALDALNQELFQLQMADKETVSDWGIHLLRHLQALTTSFPECFPPDHMAELKCNCFYGGLPKWLKAMVAYLKASLQEKTYSEYLWATREAEKEELSQSQTPSNITQPKVTSFFPLWKLKWTQSASKMPTCTWHTWKRRVPRRMKRWKVRTPTVLMRSWRNSLCILQGPWMMPRWKRSIVIILAVWSTSSKTAHW